MVEYLIKRLFLMVATMFGIIVLTFGITRLAPGDPVSSTAGGEGKVNDAAIMEGILAQRRIYGLDKPIFLNRRGEERSWFMGYALERASRPPVSKAAEVEKKIAQRELLDQSTALYPDLIPFLSKLSEQAPQGRKLNAFLEDARQQAQNLTGSQDSGAIELAEALSSIKNRAGQEGLEDFVRVWEKTRGTIAVEPDGEGAKLVQMAEMLEVALETLEKSARHPLPTGFAKRSKDEKIAYWQEYWSKFIPKGKTLNHYITEEVRRALDAPEGAPAAIQRLGPLASGELLKRLRRESDPARVARALDYLALAERRPGWRPDPRLIADQLRDSVIPPAKRATLGANFKTSLSDEKRQAVAANAEQRAAILAELDTLWGLPVLYDLYFQTDPYPAKKDIWKTIEKALSREAQNKLPEKSELRDWPGSSRSVFDNALEPKLGQINKWWKRAQYRHEDFGPIAHAWNALVNTQFGVWMGNMLRFDFDESYKYKKPVLQIIKERLPVTLTLSFLSIFLAYLIAIPLGIKSAVDYHSFSDKVVTFILFVLYSLPAFWVGEMLIIYFSNPDFLMWFPSHGLSSEGAEGWPWHQRWLDYAWHLILPVACLTYGSFASLSRYMRSSMLETIRQDFIRTARAKGLSERVVIYKHALRNSLIPILTLAATMLPALISGSVIIETVFTIDGMGKLAVDAVFHRDYPLINAIAIFSAALTLLGILLSDLSYALVDPRITYE
jgi:peptide/nickel transport system permease protein